MTEEAARAFLADLKALCGRFGVSFGTCGCCSSPWLQGANGKTYLLDVEAAPGHAAAVLSKNVTEAVQPLAKIEV